MPLVILSLVLFFFLLPVPANASCGDGEEVCFEETSTDIPVAETEPLDEAPANAEAVDVAVEQQALIEGITADLKARRLMRPKGNNALNKVRRLREIMPDHDYSLNGERYIAGVYIVLGRRALKSGNTELAEQRLKNALKLDKQVAGKQALITEIIEAQKKTAAQDKSSSKKETPRYSNAEAASATELLKNDNESRFVAPVMVAIPAGKFVMGSEAGAEDEKPMHEVTVEAFTMSKFEITMEQYRVYAVENQLPSPQYLPEDRNRPVANISWEDARDYALWLRKRTGKPYRLATEAEWEYAARAGTVTPYYTGEDLLQAANCAGCDTEWGDIRSAPVGSFPPNEFGLYDMHGNVWEWVQDCWTDNYFGRGDNSAAIVLKDCERYVLRGGSWANTADYARASYRGHQSSVYRHATVGFRVVYDGL